MDIVAVGGAEFAADAGCCHGSGADDCGSATEEETEAGGG